MKAILVVLIALQTLGAQAAGHEYYAAAEFRKAALQFQARCNDDDAEACYWAGVSYERLADIAAPFGDRIGRRAHRYFARAVALAPGERLYRAALFDFLLDAGDGSRSLLRAAARVVAALPESDPEYGAMRRRLDEQRRLKGSVNARLGGLLLMVPRAAYGAGAKAHALGYDFGTTEVVP